MPRTDVFHSFLVADWTPPPPSVNGALGRVPTLEAGLGGCSFAPSLPPLPCSPPPSLLSPPLPKVNDFRSLFPIERKDGRRRRRHRPSDRREAGGGGNGKEEGNPLGLTAPPPPSPLPLQQSVCEQTAPRMCPRGRRRNEGREGRKRDRRRRRQDETEWNGSRGGTEGGSGGRARLRS